MDMSQTEWKRTGEKYSQLNAYLTSSDCQSSHAILFSFFFFLFLGGGGGGRVHPRLDPHLDR